LASTTIVAPPIAVRAACGESLTGSHARSDNAGDAAHGGGSQIKTVVATGPGGAAWTPDEGDTWFLLEGVENYWAVAFANAQAGWLVGTDGRILKISF